jgi:hypothetical protein
MTNELIYRMRKRNSVKTNEVLVAKSNDRYEIIQDEEGKYKRKAKYESFCSIVPQNRQEKIALLNLLEGSDEATNGLKDHKGKQFEVANVIFRPYDRINEETGEQEYGVLTYLLTPDGVPYVTSSKSVYFTMKRIFEVFGEPNTDRNGKILS